MTALSVSVILVGLMGSQGVGNMYDPHAITHEYREYFY